MDAVIAEEWDDTYGGITYLTTYSIDLNQSGYAQRLVGFISKLDKRTSLEILDSLHVEYTGSMPTQTLAPTTTNDRVNQDESIIIPFSAILHPEQNELSIIVKQTVPSISDISIVALPDGTHILARYSLKAGSTASDNIRALAAILQMYASVLNQNPAYNGYLEIVQDAVGLETWSGQIVATYEATAYETRANIDPTTGLLSTDYIDQVISSGKRITNSYYLSDGYGDVTKAVEVPGGRAGPSQGSWL